MGNTITSEDLTLTLQDGAEVTVDYDNETNAARKINIANQGPVEIELTNKSTLNVWSFGTDENGYFFLRQGANTIALFAPLGEVYFSGTLSENVPLGGS